MRLIIPNRIVLKYFAGSHCEALKSENAKLKSQANELTDLRTRIETLEKTMVRSHKIRDAVRAVSITQE
jgi:hypothetical protein